MTSKVMRPMRLLRAAAMTALLAAAPTICAYGGDGDVIARIGSDDIMTADVRAYLDTLDSQTRAAIASNPALLNQAVRLYLAQQLVLKQALAQKYDQQPDVAAALERARKNNLAELYLQSVSKPAPDYPSDADIQSAYEANKTAFLVPRQFQLAQIYIALPKDGDKAASDKARGRLDDIQKKLKQKNADFAAIAQTDSDDATTAKRGGEIGWALETQIRPEIKSTALGLTSNAVSAR